MFLHNSPPWVLVATHTASLHTPVSFGMHFSPMLHIMRLLICSISKARNMSQTRPFPCAVNINTESRKTRPTLSIKKGWTPKDGQHSVITMCQVEQDWSTPNNITLLSLTNFHNCKRYIYSIITPYAIILVSPLSSMQPTKVYISDGSSLSGMSCCLWVNSYRCAISGFRREADP